MKAPFILATILLLAIFWMDYGIALPAQDKKAAQPGAGSPGLAFLEKFVGDFEIEKIMYTGPTPKSTKGTCKQTMQQGGKFLFSEFTFGDGPSATTGLGIIGYVEDSGLFVSTWIDSRQSKMSLRQSRERFNGKEIMLYSGTLNSDPKARVSRTVSTVEDGGKKILHRQFNIGDGKETLFMEIHMKRK